MGLHHKNGGWEWSGLDQGGSDKVLGLLNTSTSIIAFLTIQSCLHMLADCAPICIP